MAGKKIVILGGGYGGIEAAKKLYKRFKKDPEVEITLIDRNTVHTLMTELHEVAGSRVEPESVQVSYERIFSGKKINVVNDLITGADFQKKVLVSRQREYPYDYLVLGSGAAPEFFDLPGVQQHSFTLWSLDDAIRLRHHIDECFRLAASEVDEKKKKSLLSFGIAGAGFTGIEMAGELMERRDELCALYHIDPAEVRIVVVEALDKILPIIEDNLREKSFRYMQKHNIEILLNSTIVSADEGKFSLKDGRVIEASTFIWTSGVHSSEFTSLVDLEKGQPGRGKTVYATARGIHGLEGLRLTDKEFRQIAPRGRLAVNEFMQTPAHPEVYAVGDNIWFLENGKPLPQIVETAIQTGHCAAKNIIAAITGGEKEAFKSNFHGFMVSIGGRYGVSNAMGIKLSGFFAMAMKHFVNLHYLIGVAGINAVWAYLKHEFFDMKHNRTFMGGHFSWKIQGWWAFPLRLWLGLMWLFEGLNKVGEGWLKFRLGSKSGWMFSPGVVQKGAEAFVSAVSSASGAEAASAASGAAVSAASGAVSAASGAVSAASGAASAVAATGDLLTKTVRASDMVAPIWDTAGVVIPGDTAFVGWFRRVFMDGIFAYIPYQGFQVMVVAVEVLIGLALLGGLFTFPAAVLSIIMCFMFMFSGLFAWNQIWFMFAAFALLGGAGRALGLDHWAMPWIKKGWNSTGFARSTYLYTGEPRVKKNRK
ncbi:MAG: NAD(P)/FAD-dependent oxidoreductase [Spirochaetales bacterium]|jgi:NADH dehydrogenase|nr:NAD(P)/FAD-dependent oxidoreductase [Spirochaetales bacterium]